MNRYTLFAIMVAVFAAPLDVRAEQPSIIDRALFFGDMDISGEQISPDGQFISFLKPHNGMRNIWIKRIDEPFSAAHPVSAEAQRPVTGYFWSRDSKFILFIQDVDGDENFNVYAIDPTLPADPKTGVPPARTLTNLKGVRTIIYAVPRAKPDIIYIGLNDRDPRWHDFYQLRLSTGEKTLIRKNTERIANWVFDHDATLRLAVSLNQTGDKEFLRVDPDGLKVIYSCSVQESCGQHGFDARNKLVYMVTNKGSLNLTELEMLDPESGATTPVESDPEKRVDFGGVILSTVDYRVLFTKYEDDGVRRYFKDHLYEQEFRWLESQLPGKEVRLGARTSDERLWVVSAHSDTEPGEIYVWNPATKTLVLQYRVREDLPREALSERKPYHFKSSDGLDIPGFLTLPKGLPSKQLPLIVNPHGGPWAQDLYGYNPLAEFLANRGYAVLQPNFRGSTGYGKAYINAGDRQWGRKMQDDLTWGVKALVADGTADPKRVGIVGASYGGYAALAGVAFTPELYAAAVDIVGPSNLVTFYETIPPYFEPGLKFMYARLGDPTTSEGRTMLTDESPVTRAKAIMTPLMVFQGKNDPRVNVRESNQIVAAVRDNGTPVEYFVASDEGHGFIKPISNLAMSAAMEKFLARHMGGRYQEYVPPDVAGRLKEMTVDPNSVH
jgi:dipeptidyl aminopeptidase/acylaminoacyl peptidase